MRNFATPKTTDSIMTIEEFMAEWRSESPYIKVHTSGSTGTPKALLAEKRRMQASARITCQFLGLKAGDTALLCLPLDYIAGKMMVVRALTCGLRLVSVPPSSHPLSMLHAQYYMLNDQQTTKDKTLSIKHYELSIKHDALSIDFAAMVPLQVWQSLQVDEERQRLEAIRHLIIGGGPIDDELARRLRTMPNAVWSTYGMTETLSHIALRRLSGPEATDWYTPFDGVNVSLSAEGCLVIDAPAVHDGPLVTNDIAEIRSLPSERQADAPVFANHGVQADHPSPNREGPGACLFRILGRKDNVICSGGLKIQAEEVERLLQPHLSAPFCITRRRHPLLGQTVVLLTEDSDTQRIGEVCRRVLPRHWQPRLIATVASLPLTATGKTARSQAEQIANSIETKPN